MKPVLTSRKKIFFIASCIVCAFSACTKETYILSDQDLTWMVYDNNQVVKFQSDSGVSRTYQVYGRWRGDGDAAVKIGRVGDTLANNAGSLLLFKDGSGFTVTVKWPNYPTSFMPTSMVAVTEVVSGTTYTDVYISSAASTDSIHNVREVHYSKATGVIKFVENTGIVWRLKN